MMSNSDFLANCVLQTVKNMQTAYKKDTDVAKQTVSVSSSLK